MAADNMNQLIDRFDDYYRRQSGTELSQRPQADQPRGEEWRYLHLAADAIRDAAIYEQVLAVRNEFNSRSAAPAVVRTMGKRSSVLTKFMRVAACVLVLAGAAAVYKYASVSSSSVYEKYYNGYELTAKRGIASQDALDNAFFVKDWRLVIELAGKGGQSNKSVFLEGMAYLELKDYSRAADAFNTVLESNKHSADGFFEDEAQYYLGMAYLAGNQPQKAIAVFRQIAANPDNSFYKKAKQMSTDLYFLSLKK